MVIFRYIPEYDWIIASTSYLDEIFSPLKTIKDIIAVTTGLLIILVFILSLMINNTVVTPLKSLMARFESGASGNFSVRMPVNSKDEIGQLAQYFNDFMEKLEAYSASLKSEIKKHRQTEQFLKISEEKYRTILERMAEGYFEIDTAGGFLFLNRAMKGMLDISPDGYAGANIQSFLTGHGKDYFADFTGKIMDTGRPGQIDDIEILRDDGSACYVEISMSPVKKDCKSPVTGFSGVVRDVSERRKREQALRLSEEIFSKAFRNSPGGMFIAALKDTRLINVNDSFLKITGFTLFDLIGNSLSELNFFSSPARAEKFINAVRHGKRVKNMETGFFNAQGKKRTDCLPVRPFDNHHAHDETDD
jgi:PAS domain S-box-containing protein